MKKYKIKEVTNLWLDTRKYDFHRYCMKLNKKFKIKKTKNYAVCFNDNGDIIDIFTTMEEAKIALRDYEECDIEDERYIPGFYIIKIIENETE